MDGLGFKIIPKRKIAQHFKKGVVTGGPAHVFQVIMFSAGSNTLLTGSSPEIAPFLFPQKHPFKRDHAGIGKK